MTSGSRAAERAAPSQAEIVIIGCGGVGLALAVALASVGRRVLGVDTDSARVGDLSAGRLELLEEGLEAPFLHGLASGSLRFASALTGTGLPRVFVIAVPTPADVDGLDAGPLESAMAQVGSAASPGDLVCIRSTVPIGATRALSEVAPQLAFAACPDRSIAGRAFLEQFETPHLVGGLDVEAGDRAEALLTPLGKVVRTPNPESAEAIKLFANVERDVSFALANQFALICDAAGVDFAEARRAGADGFPRFRLARPGPVGGPCLTKDASVLSASPAVAGVSFELLRAARRLNESLVSYVADEILALSTSGPIAILGLGFKGSPPTTDVRNAFGGQLFDALKTAKPAADIRTWDPVLQREPASRSAALKDATVVVLANDHPDLAQIADVAKWVAAGAVLYDATGLLVGVSPPPGMRIRRFGDGARGAPRQPTPQTGAAPSTAI